MTYESKLVYVEPHHLIDGASSTVHVTAQQAIDYMKSREPRYKQDGVSDEDILWDFIVVNGAWIEPKTETYDWNE